MIVVGGEALVDLIPSELNSTDTSSLQPSIVDGLTPLIPRLGGSCYNVALAAGRLSAPVSFMSRMSSDPYGEALRRRLSQSHVDMSLVQESTAPTPLALVTLDRHRSATYAFYVEGTADRLFTDPGPLPRETRILSLGSLGMTLEPGASAYEAVLRRESERGLLTVLDPNIRPTLMPDSATYRQRFDSWLPHIRLLKLSEDDVAWISNEAEPSIIFQTWLSAGVDAIVLTRGAQGLSVFTDAITVTVPIVRTPIADTIGAGDTVQGALLAWFHAHDIFDLTALTETNWRTILNYAAHAAAITVSRPGAEPPTADELMHFDFTDN